MMRFGDHSTAWFGLWTLVFAMSLEVWVQGAVDGSNHWSFRRLHKPKPPVVVEAGKAQTAIDNFVLAKLRAKQLSFNPEAERAVLIRRVCFDLTGLPPTPKEISGFIADSKDGAYERMIERYLATPHYGERWGGHWLDTAGYADSNGYFSADTDRPLAWRYRDYVIRAFNTDKPFDQFVREQLAGDELAALAGWQPDGQVTPRHVELIEATHFLRNAQDGTDSSDGNPDERRTDMRKALEGTQRIIGSSLLGLKLQCARCHDHKFESVSQREYYQLQSILYPAFNIEKWVYPKNRFVHAALPAKNAVWEKEIKKLDARVAELKREFDEQSLKDTPNQKKKRRAKLDAAIKEVNAKRPPQPGKIAWVSDGSAKAPDVFLLKRGNYKSPGEKVQPNALAILRESGNRLEVEATERTTGRRLGLANWLTKPGSRPAALLARVTVNRVWQHHFGTGIVSTSDNLGLSGAQPSHPELLEWLASEFAKPTQKGAKAWSIKHLHGLIMNSAVYRQASLPRADGRRADADNRLLWRFRLRRLDAEAIRDAMLASSGELDLKEGGPYVVTKRLNPSEVVVDEKAAGALRRSVYLQQRRTQIPNVLKVFDAPSIVFNCTRRDTTTGPLQSLNLLNSEFTRARARALAARIKHDAGDGPDARITRAFQCVFGRSPSDEEQVAARAFLKEQPAKYAGQEDANQKSWADFCQMLLASNTFLYVE